MYYSVTLCVSNDGIFLEAFAAACVRARLSTITATNKLSKGYIYIYIICQKMFSLDEYKCFKDYEQYQIQQDMLMT